MGVKNNSHYPPVEDKQVVDIGNLMGSAGLVSQVSTTSTRLYLYQQYILWVFGSAIMVVSSLCLSIIPTNNSDTETTLSVNFSFLKQTDYYSSKLIYAKFRL